MATLVCNLSFRIGFKIETANISFVYIFFNFCLDTGFSLLILDDFYKIKI
jgi:hypothetical protein